MLVIGLPRHVLFALAVGWALACVLLSGLRSPARLPASSLARRRTPARARGGGASAAAASRVLAPVRRPVVLTNDPRDLAQRNSLNLTYAHMASLAVCDGFEADGFARIAVAWQGWFAPSFSFSSSHV